MQMSGNTILVTGGGSGIGRALAEAFLSRGNQVIIAGRRAAVLDEVTAANPGMTSAVLDLEEAGSVRQFAETLRTQAPGLNAVIHNAGIMRMEQITAGELADAEAIVTTNLLGPIRLTAALLPQLKAQPRATIMTVSSGLAFVPMALTPTYSATKAAIHSYSESMRYQLRDTAIEVLELVPPYVQTELMGAQQANDPRAMPLKAFIDEVMHILETRPDATEICVERVKPLRGAEADGAYEERFKAINSMTH